MSDTSNIYFTYVVRPSDAPEGRGSQIAKAMVHELSFLMRIGFALQLIGVLGTVFCSLWAEKPLAMISLFKFSGISNQRVPAHLMFAFLSIWCMGSVFICSYGLVADDDSSIKMTRGYRAGIKALNYGALLDIIAIACSAVSYQANASFYEEPWLTAYLSTGAYDMFYLLSRFTHVLAYVFYGVGTFSIEGFHLEGAGTVFAWALLGLYKATAALEMLALCGFLGNMTHLIELIYCVCLTLCHIVSLVWGIVFEPIALKYEVKLTQSAIRNEFFKSQNSIAYYGNRMGASEDQSAPPATTEPAN